MNFDQVEDFFDDFSHDEPYEHTLRNGSTRSGVHYLRSWPGVVEMLEGSNPVEFEGLGTVELIEEVGGEGEGDHMHIILRVTFPDGAANLYKKNGRWVSYDGPYWEDGDFFEVEPVQQTVTVYKKVKK